MDDKKPVLLVAAICRRVHQKANGDLTLSKLIDGASGSKEPTPSEPLEASFPLFVKMLRNGFVGEKTLYVTCRDPDGEDVLKASARRVSSLLMIPV